MYTQRLRWDIDDVQAVLVAAFESGRQQAHEGANHEYARGYLAALRVVCCGFGFQVAEPGPEVLSVDRALVSTHVR